jgi:hypothetical protein
MLKTLYIKIAPFVDAGAIFATFTRYPDTLQNQFFVPRLPAGFLNEIITIYLS